MIYVNDKKAVICKGDFHPAQLYKGDKKIAGYESAEFSTNGSVTLENCYNDNLHNAIIHGNSVQDGTPTPEAPVEVQSVGELVTEGEYAGKYKIPVKARGKNLLYSYRSTSRESLKMSVNGSLLTLDGISKSNHGLNYSTAEQILLEAGKTYTFSLRYLSGVLNDSANGFYVGLKTSSGWYTSRDITSLVKNNSLWKTTFTVTNDVIVSFSCVGCGGYHQLKIGMQLEEGSTATAYESYIKPQTHNIYLDAPLRKIGDYKDYIDFEKGVVVRNITETNLKRDGYTINSQHFVKRTNTSRTLLSFTDKKPNGGNISLFLCNRGKGNPDAYWNSDKVGICEILNPSMAGFIFSLPIDEVSVQSDFNTWVENHDTTLVYLSKTPKEEAIELPKLPTFKGTTIYEVDTEITASISGKYKKLE